MTFAQHWLICISQDNYEISLKSGLIGFGERNINVAQKITWGDRIVFYITRESTSIKSKPVRILIGVAEVSGKYFLDNSALWNPSALRGDTFAHRVPIRILDFEKRTELKPFAHELSFVYSNLGASLQKGYVLLKTVDWNLIMVKMGLETLTVGQ